MKVSLPVALTIAGSDSGGGAGIQADLLTFAGCGVFGTTAITCLTAQNPDGVSGIRAIDAPFVREQADQVASWFQLKAIKTGMLFNAEIIHAVAEFLAANADIPVVIDPVMVATSGAVLLEDSAISAFSNDLLPKATCITPNLDEAGVLLGKAPSSASEMEGAALALTAKFQVPVLLKGGHLSGDDILDLLAFPNGITQNFHSSRLRGVNTHGSGCTLSSAIAAFLALGKDLPTAIGHAIAYLQEGMRNPCVLHDQSFISH